MKLTQTIGIASALLFAAGCAHEERSVRTDETVSPAYGSYPAQREYSTQNRSSSSSADGVNSGNAARGFSQGKPSRSDNAIVAQVRETLQHDPEIAFVVPSIQISANNGAVVLTGSVQSEEQKHQIMAKVLQVTGVFAVNNQLSVMSQPNGGSQLNPTGNSGAERLYKDSNSQDNSTNNALNQISHDGRASQLYRESNQGENNSSSNELNPTSRENGNMQIYQGNPGEKVQDENSNTNNIQQMP